MLKVSLATILVRQLSGIPITNLQVRLCSHTERPFFSIYLPIFAWDAFKVGWNKHKSGNAI